MLSWFNATAFMWNLIKAGYDGGFADELSEELVIHFR